ncbi:MAG TPA: hypothetical protein VFO24_06565, partial [Usitatibacter sp.]|nr:hypothetical protein [Usitatibacter sp.]
MDFPGSWVRDAWQATPPRAAIPKTLETFALGSQAGLGPLTMKHFSPEFPLALRVAGISGAAVLTIAALFARARALPVIICGLLVPLVVLWLVSFVRPLYIVGRYDLIAFPFFPLLVGLGSARLLRGGRRARAVAVVAVVALAVADCSKLAVFYRASEEHAAERIATALLSRVQNGDLVVFTELAGLPILYRFSRRGYDCKGGHCQDPRSDREFAWRVFPLETEASMATYRPERLLSTPGAAERDVGEILSGTAAGTLHVVFNT